KRADIGLRIDGETEARRQLPNARKRLGAAGPEAPKAFGSENNIVGCAEIVGESKMLMDHADPGGEGRFRLTWRERLAKGLDRSLIGNVVAEENVHQRGLAGAILAQKPDDFPAPQVETDGIIGKQGSKSFGDAAEPEDNLRLRAHRSRRRISSISVLRR